MLLCMFTEVLWMSSEGTHVCFLIHCLVCLMAGPYPLPSEFSTECDIVLPLSVSSIFSFLKVIQ